MSLKQVAAENPCSRHPKAVTAAKYWLSQTVLEMCCNLRLQHPSREVLGSLFCALCLSARTKLFCILQGVDNKAPPEAARLNLRKLINMADY